MTDALIKYLQEKGIPHSIQPDNNNRTQHLFIAHPESLKLARAYPDIIIADCTYQTNKFGLPMLHMIGMSFTTQKYNISLLFNGIHINFK